ncbi:hypothetical protein SK571_45570 [Lentzea sp. BCCO 10_0798]|uniref:Uncharacterized protein n=1 Tax=Lentzea kristufekii TaxID=3095430 RepID=A0ABU4U9E6_9PSEU|nr:hypothetical protein [Lentzea sp. BCCO 10_0798]MDX8056682.1 hypothetical protein [Lentzea sp. BCCO 10_0798]
MTTSGTPARIYGEEYKKSERLDFPDLVNHMFSRLLLTPATSVVPAGTKFALHHNGTQNLALAVLGLRDAFLFSGQRYTCEAEELHNALEDFFEAFNWRNPDDGMDRRFHYSVHLLSESQQRTRVKGPGLYLNPPDA